MADSWVSVAKSRYQSRVNKLRESYSEKKYMYANRPIVPSYYYDKHESDYRYTVDTDSAGNRWVAMKGSRIACFHKHSYSNGTSPNAWCVMIVERFIRRKRLTCFDFQEFRDNFARPIELAIQQKFDITNTFRDRLYCMGPGQYIPWGNETPSAWINGTYYYLSEHQYNYLKKLHGIVKRYDKLNERREALLNV